MIKLVDPDNQYFNDYKDAYDESIRYGVKEIIFYNPLEYDTINLYNNFKANQSFSYFLIDDDKFIGVITIRSKLNNKTIKYGGNIEYGINPKYWNKGYGTKILSLGLLKAKELISEDKLLITCDDNNKASINIIERNGGILENKIINNINGKDILTRRYWININDGEKYE